MVSRSRTFTTYMNIEPGAANARNLQKIEADAKATLSRIQRTSQQLQTGATGLVGGRAQNASQVTAMANAERQRANAIQRSVAAQNANAVATARANNEARRNTENIRRQTRETTRLERALRSTSIAANVAQGPLGPLAGRISAINAAVGSLSGFNVGLIGAGAGLAGFARVASQAQDLKAQLRPLFEAQQDVNKAFRETQIIANDARVSLQPVVDLYSRLTLAGRDAGLNAEEIRRLTDIAAKSARLSGGNAQSQAAGLLQFSQGIGSQQLQGDELRSVRENTLRLAKAIADGLDVPLSKLKELGAEGELTPRVIADALASQADRIDEELSRLPPTISSATAQLSNSFIDFISRTDEATGVSAIFARGILALADNLSGITRAITVAALAWAGYFGALQIQKISATTQAFIKQRVALRNSTKEIEAERATERRSSAQRIVALRRERAELQQRIVQERQFANAARQTALELTRRTAAIRAQGFAANPQEAALLRQQAVAVDRARVAATNLAATKNRLRNVSLALTGQFGILTNSTRRWRVAAVRAQRAALTFGRAARTLLGAINPLGLAFAFLLPLVIDLAFRQDAAAASADRLAEAQSELARFIDLSTGKIKEQNQALLTNRALQREKQAEELGVDLRAAETAVGNRSTGRGIPFFSDPRDQRLLDVQAEFRRGEIDEEQAVERINNIRESSVALSEQENQKAEELIGYLSQVAALEKEIALANAETAFLRGDRSAETLAILRGPNFDAAGINPPKDFSDFGSSDGKSKSGAAAARREAARLRRIQSRTDRLEDSLARFDAAPSNLDRARRAQREVQQLVGLQVEVRDSEGNTLLDENGKPKLQFYTQEQADADKAFIQQGLERPIQEALDNQVLQQDIQRLRLEGYQDEADALEEALALQERTRALTEDEFQQLVDNRLEQRAINEQLQIREDQMARILSVAQDTRQETEALLFNAVRGDPLNAIRDFGNNIIDNFLRARVSQFTDQLFAGTDAKLRELLNGGSGVSRATEILQREADRAADAHQTASSRVMDFGTATQQATAALQGLTGALTGQGSGAGALPGFQQDPADAVGSAVQSVFTGGGLQTTIGIAVAAGLKQVGIDPKSVSSQNRPGGEGIPEGNAIIVEGRRPREEALSLTDALNNTFGSVGKKLDGLLGTSFLEGIGSSVGDAVEGATEGLAANQGLKLFGLPSSNTGAAIGGAIGNLIPGVGGILGGLAGGFLGGVLSGTKRGSATIGGSGDFLNVTGTRGNSSSREEQSTSLAGSAIDAVNQIAEALGATVNASAGSVSIGIREDNIRVDTTGQGITKTKNGAIDFGSDQEAAIAFAVQDLIQDGVITGISQASINILKSGQDLQRAIEKAAAIESIPRRLLAIQDPVRFAVEELNREFFELIGFLKEGGATAEQFAQAQELYDLERARAIEQATEQSVSVLQDYIDEITGGSSSPFNKRTTFENAESQFDRFRDAIAAGETVDENDLITAARNFQDASRSLFGSGEDFFRVFDDIFSLLSQARDNQLTSSTLGNGDLPSSPFETDSQVAAILGQNTDAINSQTDVLSSRLDELINLFSTNGGSSTQGGGSIELLPAFRDNGSLDFLYSF